MRAGYGRAAGSTTPRLMTSVRCVFLAKPTGLRYGGRPGVNE